MAYMNLSYTHIISYTHYTVCSPLHNYVHNAQPWSSQLVQVYIITFLQISFYQSFKLMNTHVILQMIWQIIP